MFVIINSNDIDIDQFMNDISLFANFENLTVYLLISVVVSLLTGSLLILFKPFTEIYLLYIWKFNFYFLINLVSISTTYIVFRIYGYSRLFLLCYLVMASLLLYISDKVK